MPPFTLFESYPQIPLPLSDQPINEYENTLLVVFKDDEKDLSAELNILACFEVTKYFNDL